MDRNNAGPRLAAALIAVAIASNVDALNGQFGVEFAVDAPWRLEPVLDDLGNAVYGAIPIAIEFADANFEADRSHAARLGYTSIYIGSLRGLRVREFAEDDPGAVAAETFISVGELQEIERKLQMSRRGSEPSREVCRPAAGEDCTHVLDITHAHEFHAAAWYRAKLPITPGRNILLQVSAITERDARLTELAPGSRPDAAPKVTLEWTNYVAVHAGDAPLPRFARDWLYGDVHYHSQMTDNEGESGYSYRNTARALGALGVDFVFATDHASDGIQQASDGEARDLNEKRFAAAKRILYGPDGANEAIGREARVAGFARVTRDSILPQVYMGEEVDVLPEMSIQEQRDMGIAYGDRLVYPWTKIGHCDPEQPSLGLAPRPSNRHCRERFSRANPQRDTYFVYDEQGIPNFTDQFPARQHMVYMPISNSVGSEGFISSSTGRFGGASKPIRRMLREVERSGFAFLAHPLENAAPGSTSGPDIVPYSQTQLDDAWRSPAILGLEFWNENVRRESSAPDDNVVDVSIHRSGTRVTKHVYDFRWPFHAHRTNAPRWSWQKFNLVGNTARHLYQGAVVWDRYLRKGLDPAQIERTDGVERPEPRKWFQAAGSDGHGDFNYRRAGRLGCGALGLGRWCDNEINDTALANPRNLVSMRGREMRGTAGAIADDAPPAGARRYTNREVIEALRSGNFSVTDGPAIRIVVDHNRNGVIEDTDFPMGSTVEFYPGEWIPLLVEWRSTPEFGPVSRVDVYVGNSRVTFAPQDHGPIIVADYPGGNRRLGPYQADPSGALHVRLATEQERFTRDDVDPKVRYHGLASIHIAPGQFQLAERDGELFYVRAFARTVAAKTDWLNERNCKYSGDAGNQCGDRFAYTNPVWGRYHASCPPRREGDRPPVALPQVGAAAFLDSDDNSYPDACERTLLDPCARNPETGGPDLQGTRVAEAGTALDRPIASRSEVTASPGAADERATADMLDPRRLAPTVSCQRLHAL